MPFGRDDVADGADAYPFSNEQKLFEQNGWLKSEIERLRADMVDKASMLELERRLERFIEARDKARTSDLMHHLDRAFEMGIPGTKQLVAEEIEAVKVRERDSFADRLRRSGLVEHEDGTIKPKVHPWRTAAMRNANYLIFGGVVFALANPDKAWDIVRWASSLAF